MNCCIYNINSKSNIAYSLRFLYNFNSPLNRWRMYLLGDPQGVGATHTAAMTAQHPPLRFQPENVGILSNIKALQKLLGGNPVSRINAICIT